MHRIAQVKRYWLNGTETWLDAQMNSLERFAPRVFAEKLAPQLHPAYSVALAPRMPGLLHRLTKQMPHAEADWFARQITYEGARLIHAHFGTDARYFLGTVRKTELPLVITFHGHDAYRFPHTFGGLATRYYQALWRQASRVLTVSEHMRQTLIGLGCPESKTGVLKVGVDLELFDFRPSQPSDKPTFACVAAFRAKKGLPYLVEAFANVRGALPAATLTLIGDGPLRASCEKLAHQLGVADAITFTGHVPLGTVAELLTQAQVYVQPSITAANHDKEGIPVTLMEAMARGLPCVATRHSGIPELIDHGVSGLLVPERDPSGLASAMLNLITEPNLWPSMTEAARQRVEQEHNLPTQTDKLEYVYAELLGLASPQVATALPV